MLFSPSISQGGTERVVADLANRWVESGWQLSLVNIGQEHDSFFALDKRITRIGLGLARDSRNLADGFWWNFRRVRALRKLVKSQRPNAIVSFQESANVIAVLATVRLSIPVIISQRTSPLQHKIGGAWRIARRFFYPYADAVVVQTKDVAEQLQAFVHPNRIHIIPNSIRVVPALNRISPTSSETASDNQCERWVAAAGRLSPEKGFDLLLEAFSCVAETELEWRLVIYGNGPERENLVAKADMLNISRKVKFAGQVSNLIQELQNADLFVLSSRYEGFPNVLLEAMACGLPVVSFDCDSGPREIIRNKIDGLLVNPLDSRELARAMRTLMRNEPFRLQLSKRAMEVVERFSEDKIMRRWENLICAMCA